MPKKITVIPKRFSRTSFSNRNRLEQPPNIITMPIYTKQTKCQNCPENNNIYERSVQKSVSKWIKAKLTLQIDKMDHFNDSSVNTYAYVFLTLLIIDNTEQCKRGFIGLLFRILFLCVYVANPYHVCTYRLHIDIKISCASPYSSSYIQINFSLYEKKWYLKLY